MNINQSNSVYPLYISWILYLNLLVYFIKFEKRNMGFDSKTLFTLNSCFAKYGLC